MQVASSQGQIYGYGKNLSFNSNQQHSMHKVDYEDCHNHQNHQLSFNSNPHHNFDHDA